MNSPSELDLSDDASHFRDHSFALSPFVLQLKHKHLTLKTILEVIRVLSKLSHDDKKL